MSYRDFKLAVLLDNFELTLVEQSVLFANAPKIAPSELLTTILADNIDLAVAMSTEKARSELIIAPILLEIWRKCVHGVSRRESQNQPIFRN